MPLNKWKIVCLILVTTTASLFVYISWVSFKSSQIPVRTADNSNNGTDFKDNYDVAYNYLNSNRCTSDMSNNAFTTCAEGVLEKIKAEKNSHFDKLQSLMDSRPDNVLLSDKEVVRQFHNWYKNSENNNHLRCVSNAYWTIAGSAYEQNIYTCEIFETQRDIRLLDENYKGFKDWVDKMDIN